MLGLPGQKVFPLIGEAVEIYHRGHAHGGFDVLEAVKNFHRRRQLAALRQMQRANDLRLLSPAVGRMQPA